MRPPAGRSGPVLGAVPQLAYRVRADRRRRVTPAKTDVREDVGDLLVAEPPGQRWHGRRGRRGVGHGTLAAGQHDMDQAGRVALLYDAAAGELREQVDLAAAVAVVTGRAVDRVD